MIKIPVKILLVDDEKDFVEMFCLRLQEDGATVPVAHTGLEALAVLETDPIDVVILDLKMPGMDGMDTLQEIKKRFPLVEVILLTGHGSTETVLKGMKLGAFDYLIKPADFNEIRALIQQAAKRKNEQEERIRRAEELLRDPATGSGAGT